MKKTILENCKSSVIVDVLKLVLQEHNTKINVFQKKLGLTYTQAKSYVKLLKKAGIFSANNHYCMETTPDGKLMRSYTPFEILICDDELENLIAELELHFSDTNNAHFSM